MHCVCAWDICSISALHDSTVEYIFRYDPAAASTAAAAAAAGKERTRHALGQALRLVHDLDAAVLHVAAVVAAIPEHAALRAAGSEELASAEPHGELAAAGDLHAALDVLALRGLCHLLDWLLLATLRCTHSETLQRYCCRARCQHSQDPQQHSCCIRSCGCHCAA